MAHIGQKLNMYEPVTDRICIQGQLDQRWFEYFGAQSVIVDTDRVGGILSTIVSEPMDQGALVGLISRLNALGIALISVSVTHESDVEALIRAG